MLAVLVAAAALLIAGLAMVSHCSGPMTVARIDRLTGLDICPSALIHDLTPISSAGYHVVVTFETQCAAAFKRQLRSYGPNSCPEATLDEGCMIPDTAVRSGRHGSLAVRSLGGGKYDLTFRQ